MIDTTGSAAVLAGHDFSKGSRLSTISMSVNYLGVAPHDPVPTALTPGAHHLMGLAAEPRDEVAGAAARVADLVLGTRLLGGHGGGG